MHVVYSSSILNIFVTLFFLQTSGFNSVQGTHISLCCIKIHLISFTGFTFFYLDYYEWTNSPEFDWWNIPPPPEVTLLSAYKISEALNPEVHVNVCPTNKSLDWKWTTLGKYGSVHGARTMGHHNFFNCLMN